MLLHSNVYVVIGITYLQAAATQWLNAQHGWDAWLKPSNERLFAIASVGFRSSQTKTLEGHQIAVNKLVSSKVAAK